MVLVFRSRMQNMLVAQELDIANFEDHVQSQAVARLLQDLCSFDLLWRQGWNDTSVNETVERLHVVRIPFRVYATVGPFLEVED